MKKKIKRPRKLMRARNRERVNRLRNQQAIILAPVFILVLIKLDFRSITTALKMVARLQLHIEKLTDNIYFPVTVPSIPDMQTLVGDLGNTIIDIDGGDLSKIPHRDTLMLQAENMIRKLSYDIQNQSNGNAEMIQSAGFEVRKGKGATQPVGVPVNFTTKELGGGKVKLKWKRLSNSNMNFLEITDNPVTGNWLPIGKTHKSSFIAVGLTPGQVYYFRVYGSNNLGDGNFSEPEEQRVM